MDEPSLGLAPIIVQDIFKTIRQINAEGTTVLLVEQNARYALSTAARAYVLQTGQILMSGPSSDLINNSKIKEAYLGS
jgi:branched-chain amino acid transport system ATP-binding protein